MTARVLIQARPPGQPPTLGGWNRSWPSRAAQSARTSVLGVGSSISRARADDAIADVRIADKRLRAQDRFHGPADVEPTLAQSAGQGRHFGAGGGAFAEEEAAEAVGEPIRGSGVLEQLPDQVLPFPLALL